MTGVKRNALRLSRRHLMQGALGVAGTALVPTSALAAPTEKTTVVVINLPGGLHSLHAQADSFVPKGWYGCTGSNTRAVGNGVVVDQATFGTLAPEVLSKMCNLGVWHGIGAHDLAQTTLMIDPLGQSYPLQLARAMGGSAAVACADVGNFLAGRHQPLGATSISHLSDVGGVLAALGSAPTGEYVPDRTAALAGLKASLRMSAPTLTKNQRSLESVTGGLSSVVRALSVPPSSIDWSAIASAYGFTSSSTLISGFASQLAAAELLVHAGTNVVLVGSGGPSCSLGWDTHSDMGGECARAGMTDLLLPSLRTFLARMLALPGHNVITALIGDFTRGAASEHSGLLVASVWGPHLKQGTSGAFVIAGDYDSYHPADGKTPGVAAMWAFLAAAASTAGPFGENPHPFV